MTGPAELRGSAGESHGEARRGSATRTDSRLPGVGLPAGPTRSDSSGPSQPVTVRLRVRVYQSRYDTRPWLFEYHDDHRIPRE